MNKDNIFSHNKFKGQLFAATITMTVIVLMSISDTLVAGYMIGEKAIVGLNLVTPLISIFAFISMMIGTGTAYRFSYEMGAFHKEHANKYVGQGIILALLASFIMFALILCGEKFYYDFVKTSDDIMQYTKSYYSWFPLIAASYPMFILLQDIVYADGGIKPCNIANIVQVSGNIGISIICCYFFGIAGISFGTFIGNVLAIIILSTHFFKKNSTLRFIPHFSAKNILTVFKLSYVHS